MSVRLVYILGHARSGSTVLGTILGSHPEVAAGGELVNLVGSGWVEGLYCSCGERGDTCPSWNAVREEWRRRSRGEDLQGYLALQRRFERLRRLPFTLAAARRGDPRFLEYARRTRLLLETIRDLAGTSVVVDSSKVPGRALALACAPGIDLTLIHLVRDARGVAFSLKSPAARDPGRGVERARRPRTAVRTALVWILINLISAWLRSLIRVKGLVLRYEDLAASPDAALAEVGRLVGVDFHEVGARVGAGAEVPVRHCIAGNRLRMAGSFRLRLDDMWATGLSLRDRRAVELVAGWLLRRYGYPS